MNTTAAYASAVTLDLERMKRELYVAKQEVEAAEQRAKMGFTVAAVTVITPALRYIGETAWELVKNG
jgi:hypothetical protein